MLTNDIAIVGIDSQFDEFSDIDHVARALYVGKKHVGKPLGKNNGKAFDNVKSFALVNDSTARMLDALSFSKLTQQEKHQVPKQLDVILILAKANEQKVEQSLEWQSDFQGNFQGKSHINSLAVVSQLSEALSLAIVLIEQGRLVALVGLNLVCSSTDNAQDMSEVINTISFDSHFIGYQSASGIASLLLAHKAIAQQTQLPIYALLNSLSVSSVNAHAMKATVLDSLKKANQEQVLLVEVSALADDFHRDLESSVLREAYRDAFASEPLTCAISSARSITGEGAGFSQVLGLLRTVIALQQRYIPGINHWQTPVQDKTQVASGIHNWQLSNFYFPTESRAWYANADGSQHSAAYSCLTHDSYCHLVLSEHNLPNKDEDIRLNGFLASSELQLVLVHGESETELQQKLLSLAESALAQLLPIERVHGDLKMMADQQYQQYLATPDKKYTVALLAESTEELSKEIKLAQLGIKKLFVNLAESELGITTAESTLQWKTPKGSYFSVEPVAYLKSAEKDQSNNVCFMYPGIGATYVGLGRDLFQLFPEIYPAVADLADDIASSLKDTLLNPRSISRLDFKALKQRDLALRGNLADIAEAGVAFACVFSQIFTEVFKINADFATGYSMGEVSMYAALGCWQQPGLMSARLAKSATFNERLSGDLVTLREQWCLPLVNKAAAPIWETYSIKATLAQVEAACIDEARVYCTIINTPDSVLLAGYPADCLRVINKLGVRAMVLNMANVIHSAPAKAEYDDMVALYTMAVTPRINTKLYSSSCYLPVPQLSKAIANSIAKCLCDRVDFPRLINTLYNKGARIFIEMGPGRSLCSWVDKTLDHELQQHRHVENGSSKNSVSVPVNTKGVSDELSYFRAIAKLVSHGVKLDLNSLFYGSIISNRIKKNNNSHLQARKK